MEYEYDADGNPLKMNVLNSNGMIYACCEWEYDSFGNNTKEFYYYLKNEARFDLREREYDENGNMIRECVSGEMSWSCEWEYDAAGNMTQQIKYEFLDGNLNDTEYSYWEYVYDDKGNITKKTSSNDSGVVWWIEYEYVYSDRCV